MIRTRECFSDFIRLGVEILRSSLQEFSNKNDLKFKSLFARTCVCAKFDLLKVSVLLIILSCLRLSISSCCGTAILEPYLKSVITGPTCVSVHKRSTDRSSCFLHFRSDRQ